MIKCPQNGGKIKIKKEGKLFTREGWRDEHNRGAGHDSGQLITMALLWETAEDVTWRNRGHKGGIRHEEDKKRREGGLQETCLCRYRQWKVCVRVRERMCGSGDHLLRNRVSEGSGKWATKSWTGTATESANVWFQCRTDSSDSTNEPLRAVNKLHQVWQGCSTTFFTLPASGKINVLEVQFIHP